MLNGERLVHIYHWPAQRSDTDRTDRVGVFFFFQKQFTCPPTLWPLLLVWRHRELAFIALRSSSALTNETLGRSGFWTKKIKQKSTMLISKSCSLRDLSDSIYTFHDSAIWPRRWKPTQIKSMLRRTGKGSYFNFLWNITIKDNPSFA